MSEPYYTRKLCRSLEAQGAVTYPLIGGAGEVDGVIVGTAPPHWPDRFIAHVAWQGFVEFKAYRGRVTEGQLQVLNWLVERKVHVFVGRFSPDWTKVSLTNYWGRSTPYDTWSKFFELCTLIPS